MKTLPDESKLRYQHPIMSGCVAYFPAALAGVAKHSYIGGAKYNDGALVHLRYISTEHLDCIGRHLMDLQDLIAAKARGVDVVPTYVYDFDEKKEIMRTIPIDEAILIECNALSWRSLAFSQEQHEKLGKKPLAPAARTQPLAPAIAPKKPITLLSFGKNKIGVVKALREINGYSLKDAINIVQNTPYNAVEYKGDREQAILTLLYAGATAE
jgi:large subunit ribosomal protein L7/L12